MDDLLFKGSVETLEGENLKILKIGENYRGGDAKVVQAGTEADNGILHEIDKALMPL